jgi:hypothetical protein
MSHPRSDVSFSERLAHIRRKTHPRTLLRLLLGTAYVIGAASVLIHFSGEPDENVRLGSSLLLLAWVLGLMFNLLLILRLRLDYLRVLLPWYGLPYLVWLIASPPLGEGLGAAVAYAWSSIGTLAFFIAVSTATRP